MVEWPHANFRETRLRDAMATQNHYTRRHMWTLNTTIVFVAHVGFSEGMIFLFLQVDWRLSLNFFRARSKEHICSGKVDTISTRRPSKLRPVIIFYSTPLPQLDTVAILFLTVPSASSSLLRNKTVLSLSFSSSPTTHELITFLTSFALFCFCFA